jgi:2-oxoisovalerate dehydrogenase E1 component alpha subunit
LQNARDGNGPTLVEAYTYRMGAHTTSDDPTRYRLTDELESWKLKDPIERVKAHLSRNGVADQDFFDQVETESDALAAHVREGCLSMPDPGPLSIFDHVYAEQHSLIDEEREQFAAYLDTFSDSGEHDTAGSVR